MQMPTIDFVEVGGDRFAVHRWRPDGPIRATILTAHGFPDHAPTFHLLGPAFATAGYEVVAPYLRGYAPTEAEGGPYHPVAIGLDLERLVRAMGEPDIPRVLLGHDWGAAASYPAAAALGDELAALVTLAVPNGPGMMQALVTSAAQQEKSWYMFFFQMPMAVAAVEHDDYELVERLWRAWSPDLEMSDEWFEGLRATFRASGGAATPIQYYRDTFFPPAPEAMAPERAAALGSFMERGATGIRAPSLYLQGEGDGCIGPEVADGMEAVMPERFERETMAGVGHFLHLEDPDRVHARILGFLDGVLEG